MSVPWLEAKSNLRVCLLLVQLIIVAVVSDQSITFVSIGDSGDILQGLPVTSSAVLAPSSDAPPAFRLLLGDNFYEFGVNGVDDPLWRSTFEEPFPDDGVEYLPVLGNHDHYGDATAQILYSLNHSRWAMPHNYYFRLFLPYLCVACIDTQDLTQPDQLRWLDAVLSSRSCVASYFRVVAGHHPVYSAGEHGDTPTLTSSLLPILRRRGVDLYLCGHDHDLQQLADGAITFVVSGAASRVRASPAAPNHPRLLWARGGALGFARHTVNATHLYTEFVDSASRTVLRSFAISRSHPPLPEPLLPATTNPISAALAAAAAWALVLALALVGGGAVGFTIARRRAAAVAAAAAASGDEASVRLTSAAA